MATHKKLKTNTESNNESNNHQQITNNRTISLERTVRGGGLKCILLVPIFALESAVVEAQKCYV